jgi:hypothetical protein
MKKEVWIMNLLKYALKKERWDLAAYTIILAAVRVLNQGVKTDGKEAKSKKGRAKR